MNSETCLQSQSTLAAPSPGRRPAQQAPGWHVSAQHSLTELCPNRRLSHCKGVYPGFVDALDMTNNRLRP